MVNTINTQEYDEKQNLTLKNLAESNSYDDEDRMSSISRLHEEKAKDEEEKKPKIEELTSKLFEDEGVLKNKNDSEENNENDSENHSNNKAEINDEGTEGNSRENWNKFKEIGIIISEEAYSGRFRLDKRNFDFIKFKELREKELIKSNIDNTELDIIMLLEVNKTEIDVEKRIKLKELGIYIDRNVKKINNLEIDFDKLKKIEELGIKIDSFNIEKLNNLVIDFDKLKKIEEFGIIIDSINIKNLNNLEIDFEELKKIRDLGIDINEFNIEKFCKLKIDLNKFDRYKKFGIEISRSTIENLSELNLNIKKIEKFHELGCEITAYNIREFNELEISESDMMLCKSYGITGYYDILFFLDCMKNADKGKMIDYINRKNEYLKNNRTISEQSFKELFGGSGKYGKIDINQTKLGYCYAYTGFELLKKTNGFDELIQTNLKENSDGWEVRLPFNDENGKRIKINKNEIDKQIMKKDKKGEEIMVSINSESEYLGFKILEIAFIKQSILNKYYHKKQNGYEIDKNLEDAYKEFEEKGDITLTSELVLMLEGGSYESMLYDILPESYLISGFRYDGLNNKMKDLAFNQYTRGLFKIELGIRGLDDGDKTFDSNITLAETENYGKSVIIDDAKIINKSGINIESRYFIDNDGELIDKKQKGNNIEPDIVTNKDGNDVAMFFQGHAYSIERCYTDNRTGEKRVRVINPRHTGIKFDMPLEQCKQVFDRNVTGINIDNMFREDGLKN